MLSERFKTQAAHFAICNGTTLDKSASETASKLQGRIARAFSSNSLVNAMKMMTAIQYILTAAQSLGSQDYCKKFRTTILGLDGLLFCNNQQA